MYDKDGKEYLDFAGGIAVNSLGHSDDGIAKVLATQALKIQHTSNIFHTQEPLELAKKLVESSKHLDKIFFCNSGTEANEAALKFARKYHLNRALKKAAGMDPDSPDRVPTTTSFACKKDYSAVCKTEGGNCGCWPQVIDPEVMKHHKTGILAFKGGFHGRSMGSLGATQKPVIRHQFGPFPAEAVFARLNNMKDVEQLWNDNIGTVILEPVQGEGGVNPASKEFMRDLRAFCNEKQALIVVDEVQVGLGRTGRLWAHEAYDDFAPDMMTLAKPLAGGLPIGATLMTHAVANSIAPGDHGTTYGGNALVTAVAAHVFDRINNPDFLANVNASGNVLLEGMQHLMQKYPKVIGAVRGGELGGLFVGVDLKLPFKQLQLASLQNGLLLISCADNSIRLCPPLILTPEQAKKGVEIIEKSIKEAYEL